MVTSNWLRKIFSRALSKECVSWMRFRKKHNIHLWWRWKGKEQHYFRTDLEGRYYTFFWILDSKTTSQVNKTMHIVQIHNKYKLNIENSSKLNRAHQIYFYVKRCWNAEKPFSKSIWNTFRSDGIIRNVPEEGVSRHNLGISSVWCSTHRLSLMACPVYKKIN